MTSKSIQYDKNRLVSHLEANARDHAKHIQSSQGIRVSQLKSAGQSCASCAYFYQERYMQRCKQFSKIIRGYNICAYHVSIASSQIGA